MSPVVSCFVFSALFLCNAAMAQIQVSQEPHHKIVFNNEYVRVLDLIVPPGDSTSMHVHAAQSVVVWMSNSTFGIQNKGEAAVMTKVKTGEAVFRAYGEKPVAHMVWNPENAPFRCIVVELIKQAGKDSCSAVKDPALRLQWQKKGVNAYGAEIAEGTSIRLNGSDCAYGLIVVSGKVRTVIGAAGQMMETGNFVFAPAGSNIEIDGMQKEVAGCILLQMR